MSSSASRSDATWNLKGCLVPPCPHDPKTMEEAVAEVLEAASVYAEWGKLEEEEQQQEKMQAKTPRESEPS